MTLLVPRLTRMIRIAGAGFSLLLLAPAAQPADDSHPSQRTPGATMFSESEAYERFMGRWSRRLAPPFLAFSGLDGGDSVLDVGSGTGALAAAVLQESQSARVVGIDPSRAYVDFARRRVGSDRAAFEVGDGQALRFEDDSFDRSLALLVMNFIPDPRKALGEMIRVTRPGGVVAAAVWDYGDGMEMLRIFWDEVVSLDPSAAPRDERNMPLCRAEELRELWRVSGLIDIKVEALTIPMEFASFEDFWSPFLEGQGPAGAYVASLSVSERQRLKGKLQRRLRRELATDRIELTARAWAVRGTVPQAR